MEVQFKNIPELFESTAKKYPKSIFLQIKGNEGYAGYTYEQVHSMVSSLAFNLSRSIKKGGKIAILSENRPEWCIAYLAISSMGCTAVPLDTSLTEKNIALFLAHSDAVSIFVSQKFQDLIFDIKPKLRKLEYVISFDNVKPSNAKYSFILNLLNFSSIANDDIKVDDDAKFDIKKSSELDDIASLIYTTGSSGQRKGVMLTYISLICNSMALVKKFDAVSKDSFIVLLPLYHAFAFTTIFLSSLSIGAALTFVNSLKKNEIFAAIKETKTTIVIGVPKLFESMYKGIIEKIEQQPANKQFLVKTLTLANNITINIFKKNFGKLLFKHVHSQIGDSIRLMVSGGAPIKRDVIVGMRLLGFPITEGYGLTETSPVVAVNELETIKFGSVGKPLEGIEIKIVEPNEEGIGEIAVKGPIVMKGYYKNDELTAMTIRDGWLHTKDLGYIDKDGYLFIKGRKDNVIVLPSGKNIYPEDVESHYSKSPLIQEICVIGSKPRDAEYEVVHALIVPNIEEINKRGAKDINAAIKNEIEIYSKELPAYKRIFIFDIVEPDSLPKTSTLKFKKFEIKQKIAKIANTVKNMEGNLKAENKPASINSSISSIDSGSLRNAIFKNLKKYSEKDNFGLNSHLELDMQLDSLAIAEIISNIEEECKIKVPYDIAPNISTVKDLVDLISRYAAIKDASNAIGNTKPEIKPEINFEETSTRSGTGDKSGIGDIDEQIYVDELLVPRRTEHSESAAKARQEWLNKKTKAQLSYLLGKKIDEQSLKGNIEHYIGMSQIPTGIAGPIKVNGEHAKGLFYVPLATTEGALVASTNRGMHIITKSGGANAKVISEQLTKAPVFLFNNGNSAIEFGGWVDSNFEKIKSAAESTTRHGKLIRIEQLLLGRRAILKLCYTCGDAMGANMITIATQKVCDFIKHNYNIEDYMLQSNLEGEKKVSYLNFFTGRGKRVYADAVIKKELVEKYLHTSVDRILSVAQNSCYGSIMSGMIGSNAHIANIITAIFIATGQDAAHAHDSSIGITTMDKTKDGDLYIAVNLPSLAAGTIGGGTGLGTQKECLEILDCSGPGKANKFAEIIAAAVLAGELSLAGSQSAGDFAFAHDKFGRDRPSADFSK